MEASPVRVIQYFDGTKQSLIPLFQRPYSWSSKDWEALWKDILANYGSDTSSSHFMGAIVSMPARTIPIGVTKFLIIDGQQRLTTVSILLCALRDYLSGSPEGGRVEDYLVNRHYKGADRLKLVPTQSDRDIFRGLVLDRVLPTGSSRMKEAYEFFTNKLKSTDEEGHPIQPEKILDVVEHALQVVMINLGDTDDPYLIFESLNHKGEPLSQGDLVRNFVLMRFNHSLSDGGEQDDVYKNLWLPLENLLQAGLTEFLRHYLTRDGDEPNRGAIYSAIKTRFGQYDGTQLKDLLADMAKNASFYSTFQYPGKESHKGVAARLKAINTLNVTTAYPLMLRLFDLRSQALLTDDALEVSLGLIETFIVRRSVCGVPTNALNRLFAQWSRNLPTSEAVSWLRGEILKGDGSRRCPKDDEFFERLVREDLYLKRGLARFVLERLEQNFKSTEPASLDQATIEHVMPQTLSDSWRDLLGQAHAETHTQWCHTLGNLTLSSKNPQLGNLPFDQKKATLQESHIDLNKWIVQQSTWGEHEISNRASILAASALEVWPRPRAVMAL